MFSAALKVWTKRFSEPLALGMGKLGLTPNHLTLIGFGLNIVVAIVLAFGHLFWGGVALLLVNGFDMLDGALARATGRVTKFGAFLDSSLDRYCEAVVLLGLLYFYMPLGDQSFALVLGLALVGSLMVSYTRARAEGLGLSCEVGILARPERVIVLAVGLLINQVFWALVVIAILANFTAAQRMYAVWRATKGR